MITSNKNVQEKSGMGRHKGNVTVNRENKRSCVYFSSCCGRKYISLHVKLCQSLFHTGWWWHMTFVPAFGCQGQPGLQNEFQESQKKKKKKKKHRKTLS